MSPEIPCLDIKQQCSSIKKEVLEAVSAVYDEAAFSGGPFVERFEKQFAAYCGTGHAVGLNSGTSALHLALLALGVGAGDEVIVPADTFIATAWAVSYIGATPVFVDCTSDTWNIDPAAIERAITPRTKAIIGVHLYGQPCDIDAIRAIAGERGLHFLEDAAQAHGALYKGVRIGGFGELAAFSFYPGKNLGACGEGGIVTTNNAAYAERIKRLRNHGCAVRYYHDELGFNMRMDGIQGAILEVKLRYLEQWNGRRKAIARMYHDGFRNAAITTQRQPDWADSIYHLFVITTADRDAMMRHLKQHGVAPGQHYPVPCHLQKAYAHLGYQAGACPNAEYLAEHCLSLPMYPELTDNDVARVIDAINSYRG